MHNELIKNANLLFSSLESYYIWEYLSKVLKRCVIVDKDVENNKSLKACTNGFSSLIDIKLPTHLETFQIISYLLDVVSLVSQNKAVPRELIFAFRGFSAKLRKLEPAIYDFFPKKPKEIERNSSEKAKTAKIISGEIHREKWFL